MAFDLTTQTAFTSIAILVAFLIASKTFSRKKLPPGPKGLPLIGNVLDMPKSMPWITFAEWGKQYGDMTYISLFGRPWLIVNSFPVAVDLLEKHGSIYSNRPFLQMADLAGLQGRGMTLLQNGDRFKTYRKFFAKVMGNTTTLRKYDHIEEEECQKFARRLLFKPEGFLTHVEYFAAAVIMRVAYGYQVKEYDDPYVDLVQAAVKKFSSITTPGRFLVELIPALRYVPDWFPGAEFKKVAREHAKLIQRTANEPFNWTKSQMEIRAVHSFVSDNLDEKLEGEALDRLKWCASAMYGGGGDTTVASIQAFFFAMAKYPEVQARAQAEIDQVVGNDRLPSLSDWDSLPYLRATVWEVLRWHSIGPLGLPHVSTEDNVYNGYFVPKGTKVVANIWRMMHDPEVYSNPDEFNPSRFLKIKESDVPERDPRLICFGFGRRICPGRLMAEASIFISCATILSTFNITENPKAGLKYEVESSTISHLKPFKCDLKPRSAKAIELIKKPLPGEDTI
ncbi:hypothetical protein AX16_006310 [Volvariella volvacea WC 439]|nr:hypothetical protein AX16_006310 [Volvariella volvacea WC 439]